MRKLSLLAPLACGVALIALSQPCVAQAASTIAITVGPDPVESIATQLGVTGASAEPNDRSFLKVKPGGGRGCAANAEADEGAWVIGSSGHYVESPSPYSESVNWTFDSAGSYLLCAWLQHDSASGESVVASASLALAVRQPHLALSIAAPASVEVGQTFQVALTAQAETEREAYEFLLPDTGRGCPANADAAYSTSGGIGIHALGEMIDGGPTTITDNVTLDTLGAYLVCAYFEYGSTYAVPEATAVAAISVVKPTPPCVVPRLGVKRALGAVERRIRAAHCGVGRVIYTASAHLRRGLVLSLRSRPGSVLATGAAVAIDVSSGPPPRPRHRHRRRGRHRA